MCQTSEPLNDREIASLLGDELDPTARQDLIARLDNDPEAQKVLGSAAGEIDLADKLPSKLVESIMKIVKNSKK